LLIAFCPTRGRGLLLFATDENTTKRKDNDLSHAAIIEDFNHLVMVSRPFVFAVTELAGMFVVDWRFFCCTNSTRLIGNTGELFESGAVPATVIHVLLLTIQ